MHCNGHKVCLYKQKTGFVLGQSKPRSTFGAKYGFLGSPKFTSFHKCDFKLKPHFALAQNTTCLGSRGTQVVSFSLRVDGTCLLKPYFETVQSVVA